jgi:serine/threonine protein kinase
MEDAREYALKIVEIDGKDDQKFLEQVQHEMRVASMLDHPNLIKLLCLEQEKDWRFRVKKVHVLIEYVNGKTLDQLPAMPMSKLVDKFLQISAGLAHMHRRGVFHADLKPNNIMMTKAGAIKILDFGLAWIKGEPKERVQGTPEYMAPETARAKVVNERSDIYNFGATMYRLTTWKLPPSVFGGLSSAVVGKSSFKSLYEEVCKVAPTVPAELGQLIDQCMKYDPNERPERMSEITARLQDVQELVGEPEEET